MGNSHSAINITLDRAQPTIYYTGDIISGQVQFPVPDRTGKIDDFDLIITGDVGYTTTRATRMQNGQTDRQTNRHDICIYRQKVVLGQIMYTQEKQASGTINDMANVERGQYTCPFSVRLPDTLPPTLHPTDYPFIRYELQLIIDKKWYCANTRLHYPLRIYPRINLRHISNSQYIVRFDTTRKDITIKGILQRSGLVPGEQIMLSLDVYNPIQLLIKRIDICLIQRYEIEHCRRRLEISRVSVPQLFDTNDAHIGTTCPLKIARGIPPSYHFRSRRGRSTAVVSIYYDIKLEVKAKGLFSDFELLVPVTIGTDLPENSDSVNMTANATTPMDFHDIDTLELQVRDDDISSPSHE